MSNSLEAFDRAYQRGFRLIEADFEITPDGAIVLLHDWQGAYRYWFGRTEPLPHAEFMAARMRGGLTPMDFQALLAWLERHPDARVITDVKRDNLRVLAGLAQTERRHQFIPQVYSEQEIAPVRAMGFRDVIFTNYRAKLGRDELRRLDPALYAVTVPWREAADLDRRVFVHTVNSRPLHTWLVLRGIDGIYTDTLAP
ncbi:MAG: glycerophosphodiester phosphodiesterase family protein [Phenylobacterium sp.]|uniref:glycerophosphodiester phosphodiesterase family protein n=1 Tax=Phenylobacterium sp. TaxID=1871053 RepID=UPI002A370773|nr:glycerophosphodiester phosphodiesterase family protein [Phenylobacterium sp.]MDX9999069.1 glycerophosphodiester phosphodiesterase family protein [Phenylobacterium sp.]